MEEAKEVPMESLLLLPAYTARCRDAASGLC